MRINIYIHTYIYAYIYICVYTHTYIYISDITCFHDIVPSNLKNGGSKAPVVQVPTAVRRPPKYHRGAGCSSTAPSPLRGKAPRTCRKLQTLKVQFTNKWIMFNYIQNNIHIYIPTYIHTYIRTYVHTYIH